jgi:hypothetical protein
LFLCFLTLFCLHAVLALRAGAPPPFAAGAMLLGIEAAIDDCVKLHGRIGAAKLTIF